MDAIQNAPKNLISLTDKGGKIKSSAANSDARKAAATEKSSKLECKGAFQGPWQH